MGVLPHRPPLIEMRLGDNPVYRLELARHRRQRGAVIAPLAAVLINAVCLSLVMYRAREGFQMVVLLGSALVAAAGPIAVAAGTARAVASEYSGQRLAALALTSVPAYDILRGKFHAVARAGFVTMGAVWLLDLFAIGVAFVTGAPVEPGLPAAVVSLAFVGLAGCYLSGAVAALAATLTRSPGPAMGLSLAAAGLSALLWAWPLFGAPETQVLLPVACVAAALFLAGVPVAFSLALTLLERSLSHR